MRTLGIFSFLLVLALPAVGDTDYSPCLLAQETTQQQQNCCKANKGICGCRAGKIVCCDKTFAEGCPCAREDDAPIS
jgi:hypothetical protein